MVAIQEGVEFAPAYEALERAEASVGDPRGMALALVHPLDETCIGLTQQLKDQLARALLPDGVKAGRRERIRPLLACLAPLYSSPDLATWCRALACILDDPSGWLKVDLRMNVKVLAQLRPAPDDPARELLDRAARRHREGAPLPRRCVSTIHKAKGQEYDHVIVVPASASVFPDSEDGRRLLYTAISRAKRSLTIIVPEDGASDLVSRSRTSTPSRSRGRGT